MRGLIRFSLKQVVLYNLCFVLLIVAGAFALLDIPVERYPPVNFGEVLINTYYPGASPDDVETLVTRKLEESLETVEAIEYISSTSYREYSNIHIKFIDDSDYPRLYDEVRFKLLGVLDELPAEVRPPEIQDVQVHDHIPVAIINLSGTRDNRSLSLMAEDMKIRLRQIEGIKTVKIQGEDVREFHVFLDPQRLRQFGITFEQVAQALERANLSIPAGDFSNASGEFIVRVDEKFRSRQQVLDTIVRRDGDGGFVRVADLSSRAGLDYRDATVLTSVNGQPSVGLSLHKARDGNSLRIMAAARDIIEEFRPLLAREGVSLTITQDSSLRVQDGISTLGWNMLVGIVLVSIILWYFVGLRNAILTTIGIPFSFMVTLLIMYVSGYSLNEVTLFSFVLVSGIIVDDAIVVIENIFRHVEEGVPLRKAIIDGAAEVALPVIAATSTTIAAFLPMLMMTGSTGEFFALVPITVSYSIGASLLECLLILPIHYLDFGPRPRPADAPAQEHKDNLLMRIAHPATEWLVSFTLRFRITSVLLVFAAFIATMTIMLLSVTGQSNLIRIKFFPDDYSLYHINIDGPGDATIEMLNEKVRAVADFVIADGPGMAESAAGFAGMQIDESYRPVFAHAIGSVQVTLPVKEVQHFADYPDNDPLRHLEYMRERLQAEFARDGYSLNLRAQQDGPPTGKDVNVRVLGTQFDSIRGLSDELLRFMRENPAIGPHLMNLDDDMGTPKRLLRFKVKAEQAHEYDLSTAQVAQLAASVLDGRLLGKFRVADEEIDFKLLIEPRALPEPAKALDIPLLEHPSGPVRLGDLVSLEFSREAGFLNRYQGKRSISLSANLKPGAPTSAAAVVKQIQAHYAQIRSQYPGAGLSFGGAHEDTRRSYLSLTYAFGVAVLIMYMILATQFQSYTQPLIILSAIIFALIGVIFGKLVTQSLFTVNSFVAVIGVTGVVVNDSLVLLDFINKRYRAGLSRREAIRQGIRIRLRPILLTTLTTTLGLLPMALGIPSYSLVWGSMASTFVTGLATATFLTLFIVPVLWDLLEGARLRLGYAPHGRAGRVG